MSDQEQQYRRRQWETFNNLGTKPSDWTFTGEMREVRDEEGKPCGTCELCRHSPIAYKFYLASVESKLGVGSECVVNFPLANKAHGIEGESEIGLKEAKRAAARAKKAHQVLGWLMKDPFNLSYKDAKAITSRFALTLRKDHLGVLGLDKQVSNRPYYGFAWSRVRPDWVKKTLQQIEGRLAGVMVE